VGLETAGNEKQNLLPEFCMDNEENLQDDVKFVLRIALADWVGSWV